MRKRYLIVAFLSMFIFLGNIYAVDLSNCEVLISFKQSSSLDEDSYICKGQEFGNSTDNIYYSGKGNEVRLLSFNGYYFNVKQSITLNITEDNNISLLLLNNNKLDVTGSGSLKFKEGSFVKKVIAGEPVYQYVYNGKKVINDSDKIYEGTISEFENNYTNLKIKNHLPEKFNIDNYQLSQVMDFINMSSVAITDAWLEKHIDTKLSKTVLDGYGIIKFEEKKEETQPVIETKKEDNKTLESDNVVFVSDKKVGDKYKLNVDDLNATEVAKEVSSQLRDSSLLSFYDVNVYNGKKQVPMKNGQYTIKIKLDQTINESYQDYQIIYVNDNGEIEEYLTGVIEGEYIVFNTTHLSQYGVIAKEKVVEEVMLGVNDNSVNIGNVFKIGILLSFVLAYLIVISILIVKSKLIKFKFRFKKHRKRTN